MSEKGWIAAEGATPGFREIAHSSCSVGFGAFSVLTVTKERTVIVDFETMLKAGDF